MEVVQNSLLIDGADEPTLAALRAQALAEVTALPPAEAQVTSSVRATVVARLRDIYSPHAQDNYHLLADGFTKTAAKLAAAMRIIDPDTQADEVINADTKIRTAWTEAQQHAAQLTATLPALRAAASLAGITANTDEVLIPLTADVTGLHRHSSDSAPPSKPRTSTTSSHTGDRSRCKFVKSTTGSASDTSSSTPKTPRRSRHECQRVRGLLSRVHAAAGSSATATSIAGQQRTREAGPQA